MMLTEEIKNFILTQFEQIEGDITKNVCDYVNFDLDKIKKHVERQFKDTNQKIGKLRKEFEEEKSLAREDCSELFK